MYVRVRVLYVCVCFCLLGVRMVYVVCFLAWCVYVWCVRECL
jgi:hypothetical protein